MKVLLCYPCRDNAYHKIGFLVPPLGLGYLAAVLRDHGHEPAIVDFNVTRDTPDYASYDVVGISCDTSRVGAGIEIAARAKEAGVPVVMGGPHVTFDDEVLREGLCDVIVRGEGEWTFLRVVERVRDGGDLGSVRGISFMSTQGSVVKTPDADLPELAQLPHPARDLLGVGRYGKLEMGGRKMTPIITSRGCPYDCSFCASSSFSGRRWRARAPEQVLREIEEIVGTYGFRGIAFLDDNFTLDPERVKEICERIIQRGLDLYWWCFSRADTILRNEAMVAAMARAGAKYVFMGFESRSAATLDNYRKRLSPDSAGEAVRMLRRYGISTHASFILGDVGETEEMVKDTIRYARELSPEAVQFSLLTPYPGTRLYEELRSRIFNHNWDDYDCLHPVLALDHLPPERLMKLLRRAYLSFYLSPRRLFNGLFSAVRGRGIKLSTVVRLMGSLR
ncbi:MAG: B12-binding domain-containing radical SAM protein [Thermodesulfovibrionales bacterium]